MRGMQVVIVSDAWGWGGAEEYARDLALELRAARIDVTIVTTNQDVYASLPEAGQLRRCHRPELNPSDGDPAVSRWIALFRELACTHLVVQQTGVFGVVPFVAARLAGVRRVIERQCIDVPPLSQSGRGLGSWRIPALMRQSLVDLTLFLSRRSRDNAVRYWGYRGDSVEVLYNGIDPDRFALSVERREQIRAEWGVRPQAVVVGATSRFQDVKGMPFGARSVLAAMRADDRLFFVAAGAGPEQSACEQMCRASGLQARCRFLGHVDDVARVLSGYDVFLLPSRREAFGRSVIEAMAAGLPVVCTAVGGVPEVVRDGVDGFLVGYGSEPELVRTIRSLSADPGLRERLGRAGRARVLRCFTRVSAMAESLRLLLGPRRARVERSRRGVELQRTPCWT